MMLRKAHFGLILGAIAAVVAFALWDSYAAKRTEIVFPILRADGTVGAGKLGTRRSLTAAVIYNVLRSLPPKLLKYTVLGEMPKWVDTAQPSSVTDIRSDLVVGFCGLDAHGRPVSRFFSDAVGDRWYFQYAQLPNTPQGATEARCVEAMPVNADMTSCFINAQNPTPFHGSVMGNAFVQNLSFVNATLPGGAMFFSSAVTPTVGQHIGKNYLCCSPQCGDGCVDPGGVNNVLGDADDEECDLDANNNSNAPNQSCRTNCKLQRCGDGIVDTAFNEECDDGNAVNTDACNNTCTLPRCGDEIVQSGEQCDDGNTSNTDACLNTCVAATCGDGFVRAGVEGCDDGNTNPKDDCTHPLCQINTCGDGIVNLALDANGQPKGPCDPGPGLFCRLSADECVTNANCLAGDTCGTVAEACTPTCGWKPGWGGGLCVWPPSQSLVPVRTCQTGFGGPQGLP